MSNLATERHGPVLLLTLDRPEVRNALSLTLREELSAALTEAAGDASIRVVVITGRGPAFCAGVDLDELAASAGQPPAAALADSRALADLFRQIIDLPQPVIAAVNGAAVAGGAGLVNACDIALAAASARFGYTEARIGFVPAIVAALLVRQVGDKAARRLLLGADLIDATEALRIGLITEVVPDDELLARALDAAGRLARNAPGSLAVTKELLSRLHGLELDAAIDLAVTANASRRSAPELAEGVRAFLEKRAPSWLAEPPPDRA